MSYTQKIKDKIKELADNSSEDCTSISYGFKESGGKLTKEKSIIFSFKKKKKFENEWVFYRCDLWKKKKDRIKG